MTRRIVLGVVILAVLLAACTDGADGASPTDPTTATTLPQVTATTTLAALEAIERFQTCMDESGIDLEPIPFDAQGRPRLELVFPDVDFADPEAVMALTSCAGFLETGALDLTSNPLLGVGVVELLNEFSQCVRSKGVPDFPDPIEGFSGIGGPYPLAEIPFADPDLEGAVDTCRSRISGLGS